MRVKVRSEGRKEIMEIAVSRCNSTEREVTHELEAMMNATWSGWMHDYLSGIGGNGVRWRRRPTHAGRFRASVPALATF